MTVECCTTTSFEDDDIASIPSLITSVKDRYAKTPAASDIEAAKNAGDFENLNSHRLNLSNNGSHAPSMEKIAARPTIKNALPTAPLSISPDELVKFETAGTSVSTSVDMNSM